MVERADSDANEQRRPALGSVVLFFGPLVVLLLVGSALPLEVWLPASRRAIEGLGGWGVLAFVIVYVLATNVGLPGMPLTLAAGALFDTLTALAVACLSSTLSACTMFLVARRLGSSLFGARARRGRLAQRFERLLERHGPWVVGISRLLPMPFMLVNYSFGVSGVEFRTYTLWSFVGMIPMNVLFVMSGNAFARWVASGSIPEPLVVGLAALAALAVLLGLLGRRLLQGSRIRSGR